MFRHLPPAKYGPTDDDSAVALQTLAKAMAADVEEPIDGPDPEESGIPALYTYFGQFIDHDITFDPVSSLTKQSDPDGLTDFRTPALDLDNLYGRGPGDQPYMYDLVDTRILMMGETITGAGDAHAKDLPRFNTRALIGDPRNDENSIVSQLQGLFIRFHNRLVEDNPKLGLSALQRLVRFHYQYVVLNDFLPRIVSAPVLDALKIGGHYDKGKLKFFHWRSEPFMPVEFSVAAYRLGHSMIRPEYQLNDATLLPIFPTAGHPEGLTGFQTLKHDRAIDWGRFIDVDLRDYDGNDTAKSKRLQFAYRIDTSLVGPLSQLPSTVVGDPPPSLGYRNLLRGLQLGLPSGQSVARAMKVPVLKDKDIVLGKAVDKPEDGDVKGSIVEVADQAFAGNCPLWTYILAEAAHHRIKVKIPANGAPDVETPQLGPVGGRIVAEVFLGMLFGDGTSMVSLDPHWHPATGPDFRLKDIVSYALGNGPALSYPDAV